MKKVLSYIVLAAIALLGVSSCIKEEKAVFDVTKVTAPTIVSYVVEEDAIVVKYSPAVVEQGFNEKIAPNHTLAIVSVGDQACSKTLSASDKENVLTVKNTALVKALMALGQQENTTVDFELAVRATIQDVARDNGRNGHVDSETTVKITGFEVVLPEDVGSPYEEYTDVSDWSLIGSMAAYEISWDKDLNMWTDGSGNHVAAHVTLKAGDEVKFRKDQSWDVNMGGDFSTLGAEFAVSQDGPNIKITVDGVYDLFLSVEDGTAVVAAAYDPYPAFTGASNWSVIGALSLAGINWDGDIAMVSDGTSHAAFSVALGAEDEFKFRQDQAWTVNLGGDFTALGAEFAVSQDGPNIKVGAAGVFDLFVNPGAATATVTEASGVKVSSIIGAEPGPGPEPEEVKGWNIIGLNGDWENDILATEKDGVWTAYITAEPAEGEETTAFKWRKDGGWDDNYGIAKDATYTMGTAFPAEAGGENISIAKGFYKVVLDLSNAEAPTITIYDDFEIYSLIGDFNSWAGDVDMTETEPGIWVSPATALTTAGFKIRSGHDWTLSYGGTLVELGVAFDAISADGPNIVVPADGEYVVTFDKTNLKITVEEALPSNVWSLIGVNGDWGTDIFMTELMPGVWVSPVVDITSAGWKVRFNRGWDVNRGGAITAEGVFAKAVPGGDNINLTGKFQVVYNANNETIGTLVWGVVGSIASIDGFSWNKDVPMNLASDGKWYSVPVTLAATDEIKIRKYADWAENFGGDFVEANTAFAAVDGGGNIKGAEGTYVVVYDPTAATLTLSTNFWGLIGDFNSWGGDKFMMFDGANFVAYNQTLSGGWKIRKTADWADNRGGVFAEPNAFFTAAPGGDNINVGNMAGFDVVYVPSNELIFIGDVKEMPEPDPQGGITIDGDFSDWDEIEGVIKGNHGFKFTYDDKYAYFLSARAKDEDFDSLWGSSEGYVYVAFDMDKNPATGDDTLWGNGPFEYVGVIWPYGGTAAAPSINKTPDSASHSTAAAIPSIKCDGAILENGVAIEFCIALEDLPALPADPTAAPFIVYSWGSPKLSKVEYHVGEEQPSIIAIDGDMSDWAEIEGIEAENQESAVMKAFKAVADSKYIYLYFKTDNRSAMWNNGRYMYVNMDTDNNQETGFSHDSVNGLEAYTYFYMYGGTADAPAINATPSGKIAIGTDSAKSYTLETNSCAGVIGESVVETEVKLLRSDFPLENCEEISLSVWANKDASTLKNVWLKIAL